MIDTPSQAIALLGGAPIVASLVRRPPTTVSSWASRESIPVEIWPALIALAKDKRVSGITYEALTLAHAKRRAA